MLEPSITSLVYGFLHSLVYGRRGECERLGKRQGIFGYEIVPLTGGTTHSWIRGTVGPEGCENLAYALDRGPAKNRGITLR